jgi:hypothetical protein
MRLRWLWRQKQRIDRGQQIVGLLNLALLLVQSETLKQYMGATATQMLVIGLPSALCLVWCFGYVITLPAVQQAEDRALSNTTQMRRDVDEILRLLKCKDTA